MQPIALAALTLALFAQAIRPREVPDLASLRPTSDDVRIEARFFNARMDSEPLVPGTSTISGGSITPGGPPDYKDALPHYVCDATWVVVGTAQSAQTLISEDATSLFTRYRFVVEQWIRPGQRPNVDRPAASTLITVSKRGGTARIGGKLTEQFATGLPDLGRRYVLMLKPIPGTTSHQFSWPGRVRLGQMLLDPEASQELPAELRPGTQLTNTQLISDVVQAARTCPAR